MNDLISHPWAEAPVADIAAAQAGITGHPSCAQKGFVKWRDADLSPPPMPLHVVTETNTNGWFQEVNNRRVEVPALGCFEVFDVDLHYHGILWHGETIVTVSSHIGDLDAVQARKMDTAERWNERVVSDRPGIIIAGSGHMIYGHWLVDFIPRLKVAKLALGSAFGDYVIPLPSNTPPWALALLETFCGVTSDQICWFELHQQHVYFKRVMVPTYGHSDYPFHPATAEFWPRPSTDKRNRKFCISRKNFEKQTYGVRKIFENRLGFEQMAADRGFEIIYPEILNISEQIDLFSNASHVVGEYGSALHSMLFAPESAVIGMIRCPNDIQLRISALKRQYSVLLFTGEEHIDNDGAHVYSMKDDEIFEFLRIVDSY